MSTKENLALGDLRIIDLANHFGILCGKLFADMGADVIKVERPGGDPMRSIGPFYRNHPHPERSLYWWHYNTNKRGITLNIESEEGRDILKKLVRTADALIESFPVGYLDGLGMGWEVLSQINPGLVLTSITPYGQTGPYHNHKGSEIVIQAMSGMMSTLGEPDGPPLRWAGAQAMHSASFYAAIGTMCALLARHRIGRGQRVDVSMEEASASAVENVNFMALYLNIIYKRQGGLHWTGGFKNSRASDEWLVLNSLFGDWQTLINWLDSEGMVGDLKDPKYENALVRRFEADHVYGILEEWASRYPRQELIDESQLRRLPCGPVNTVGEVAQMGHLHDRGYFHDVEHPELGTEVRYPGAPYLFHHTPWRIRRRAPLIGEDNMEVYQELGYLPEQLAILAREGVI